jgi:2-polyprenyl-6-methoxyphenol hydroxylase-like FAD-dependent oxidoreductase
VFYPISEPDPATGLADINWVAEITVDNSGGWREGDWNRKVRHEEFMHHFDQWNYDWIDIPGMLRGATEVFEYPMIDREPIPTWRDGNTVLLGDAAHVMYPTGSNGASQAIVDARVLGAAILKHGVNAQALKAYDERLCPEISPLILRNRGAGPFGLLNLLDDRCGGVFDDIDAVIPQSERDEFMQRYKVAAGFAAERLHAAPPLIQPGIAAATSRVEIPAI